MQKLTWIKNRTKQEVLESDKKFWDFLVKNAYPKTKGKFRVPISLEPFVIEKEKFEMLEKNLLLVITAAKKLAEKYFEDSEIQEIIAINEREKRLIEKSVNEDFVGIVRADLFYANIPKMVEINADFPDGFFMHDVTLGEIAKINEDEGLKYFNHAKLFSELLEKEGVKKDDHIFVGYDKERVFSDEFYLSKLELEKLGWCNISVGAFEDLEFRDGNFYFKGMDSPDKPENDEEGDKKIDVIRRGAELFKLRKIPGLIENLILAQNNGLRVFNNFKMRLLGHKSLMAALHDARFFKYLESEEIEAIKELLPKTIKLDKCDLEEIKEQKDLWVLKPADLAEGEGIAVGNSLTQEEWNNFLDLAINEGRFWILQEKIEIPEAEFNLVSDNRIISEKKKFDFNPHVILLKNENKVGNILVRFSDSSILNIMKGGGLTYSFIKE